MIKTSVYIGTSLDGFIAKTDGDIEWLVRFESGEIAESYQQFLTNIDAHVIGRGTFEKILTFPTWIYEKKVFLLSTTIKELPSHLNDKVTILAMTPPEILSHLSAQGYSNIYIDGGKVIQQFLKEDCVDELIITRVPTLLGQGIPLFGLCENDLDFSHEGTHVFANGLVKSHYKRIRNI